MDNLEESLFLENYIEICLWFDKVELLRIQTLSKEFQEDVLPNVIARKQIFNKYTSTLNQFVHWFKDETKNVFLYDPISKKQFKLVIDREIPTCSRTIAIDNQKVILCGGFLEGSRRLTWMCSISHLDITVTEKKDMNQRRDQFGITYDDKKGEVYVFGGKDGMYGAIDHSEKYSVEKDEWTELQPMPKPKWYASACIISTFIFVVGGMDSEYQYLNEIEKYFIDFNAWETIKIKGDQKFPPRNQAFSCKVNSLEILIAGGEDEDNDELKDCYTLNAANNALTKVEDFPGPNKFESPSAILVHDQLLFLGEKEQEIYKYSINKRKWDVVHQFK